MDDGARDALREIIASEGEAILDDPRRFRALLLDRCGGSRVEVKLLIASLEEGVPAMMLSGAGETPTTVLCDRLTRRLEEARSLAPEPARWSVESWALALGIADRAGGPRSGASGTEIANRTAAASPAAGPAAGPAPAPATAAAAGGQPDPTPGGPPARPPSPAKGATTKKIVALAAVGVVVATVITLIALNTGGGSDAKNTRGAVPTTSSGAANAPTTTTLEAALRSHIPPLVKDSGTCAKPDVRAAVRFNNVPVLGCDLTVEGTDVSLKVFYYSLPDQTTIDGGLDTEVAKYGLGPGSCDPDVDPAFSANNGTFYTDAHVPVGRVLCGVDANGNPFMQWTDTRLKIYQSAIVSGPSAANPDKLGLKKAMFAFWRKSGGLVA